MTSVVLVQISMLFLLLYNKPTFHSLQEFLFIIKIYINFQFIGYVPLEIHMEINIEISENPLFAKKRDTDFSCVFS